MGQKISPEELSTMIANEIRSSKLSDVISIDDVKNRVQKKIQEFTTQKINELETPEIQRGIHEFPTEDNKRIDDPTADLNTDPIPEKIGTEAGAQPLEQPVEPKTAIPFELPDFLKNVEPGKVIVFDYNELSVGAENLSNKPLRTFEDPDKKRSMNDMWSSEGKVKSEVFIAKFEKIGSLEYDYKNGTTKFIEKRFDPELTDSNGVYNQNPYVGVPQPELDKKVEDFIKSNINLEQVVNNLVTNIVKNYFLTNTERAVNDVAANNEICECEMKKEDLVGINNGFEKIDTPAEIIEALENKKSKAKLVFENDQIRKFALDEKEYFFLADQISTKKCYAKTI